MPSFEHHGAHIYYEEFGQGFPILTFAPAGLQSAISVWSQPSAPINPTTESAELPGDRDGSAQRGRPVARPDHRAGQLAMYTGDHIALLDHLRIDRCHLYGQCIGGSLILSLIKAQPERIRAPCWRSRSDASARWRRADPPGSTAGRKR